MLRRNLIILLTAALLAPTAHAQNNSLFSSPGGAASSAAPTNQPSYTLPSERTIPLVVTRDVLAVRQPERQEPAESIQNPTLLALSPISVAAPEPKKAQGQ